MLLNQLSTTDVVLDIPLLAQEEGIASAPAVLSLQFRHFRWITDDWFGSQDDSGPILSTVLITRPG